MRALICSRSWAHGAPTDASLGYLEAMAGRGAASDFTKRIVAGSALSQESVGPGSSAVAKIHRRVPSGQESTGAAAGPGSGGRG